MIKKDNIMKTNQITRGDWLNKTVFFNGVMGSVVDHCNGRFLVCFHDTVNTHLWEHKWIDNEHLVWG